MDVRSSLRSLLPVRKTLHRHQPADRQARGLPARRGRRARPGRLRLRLPGPRGPAPPLGRALHHPPGRRRRPARRPAPRRADARSRPSSTTSSRTRPTLKDEITTRFGADVARARRRRQQARPDPVQQPRRGAGRELPQDAARDGARHPRHHRQARRPHPQHAHARRHAARQAPQHRARDARDLRADRQPPRHALDQGRARGPRLPLALPAPLQGDRERGAQAPRATRSSSCARSPATLAAALEKAGIPARVEGREKDVYSIYTKMRRKKVSLAEIVDVYGIRIVVDRVDTCYRALGIVHKVYKPMPGRFKDYIAIPRVERLPVAAHDDCSGRTALPIEVQIRTEEMHHVAESGIAAHWQYKDGDDSATHLQRPRARVAAAARGDPAGRQLRGVPRERQGRPVPGQGLRVHAEGRHPPPAARLDLRRLRLRRAHRRRQPLRRRQGRPPPRAAQDAAAQRPDGRDHHGQGRDAEPVAG